MNNNSTQFEIRNFVKKLSYSKKTSIAFIAILPLVCGNVTAQNTGLPNIKANLKNTPAGSIIIAMDNTNQGKGKALINFNPITVNTVKLNISTLQDVTYDFKVSTRGGNNFQNKMIEIN